MRKPCREKKRIICAVTALFCAALFFTLLFSAYAKRFDRALAEENYSRLEEVSSHVANFIERAVEQQWKELYAVAEASATMPDNQTKVEYLGRMADKLHFTYIGLADNNGVLHSAAFREPVDISQNAYFQAAQAGQPYMTDIKRHIFWDKAVTGIILSMPTPAENGTAVVAMLSMAKLRADMEIDSFQGGGNSYIIDGKGDLVLHAKSMAYHNFYQTMANMEFDKGYTLAAMRGEIESRRAGMTAYCELGVQKYAYYRPLNFNNWSVVSIVPKQVVTARTSALSKELIIMCIVAIFVFLVLLSIVGLLLLRLESRRRANKAKSDFLANMSHDMRTPMNAIIGMTSIAQQHAQEPETVRDCMRKITFSSKHLLGLINDVLDMSRMESGKMTLLHQPFSLSDVLESTVNMVYPRVSAKKQHFFMRIIGVKNERFTGDSLRIIQICVNILTNAVKFTQEGGTVIAEIEECVSDKPGYALFRLTFSDNGIGMSPAFLKEIFTPFVRERSSAVDNIEGSGLGMAITKQIVDLMGGHIEIKSEENRGSMFIVTLPLLLDTAALQQKLPFSWRILLVGGEENAVFEEAGQSIQWAPDVKTAAAFLQGQDFEAVFIDRSVYTPEDTAVLSAAACGSHLFLLSYDWEDIQKEAAKAGIEYFLQKPLLVSTLKRALGKAAGIDVAEPERQGGSLQGKRILLAEDNELNLEIAKTILSEAGAETAWARDGAECISMFESSPAGGYDLILMDIQMPRVNGYEAAAHIRSLSRPDVTLPILAMSANAYAEDMEKATAAGMDGYLTKPIDMAVWMDEIRKALRLDG